MAKTAEQEARQAIAEIAKHLDRAEVARRRRDNAIWRMGQDGAKPGEIAKALGISNGLVRLALNVEGARAQGSEV